MVTPDREDGFDPKEQKIAAAARIGAKLITAAHWLGGPERPIDLTIPLPNKKQMCVRGPAGEVEEIIFEEKTGKAIDQNGIKFHTTIPSAEPKGLPHEIFGLNESPENTGMLYLEKGKRRIKMARKTPASNEPEM